MRSRRWSTSAPMTHSAASASSSSARRGRRSFSTRCVERERPLPYRPTLACHRPKARWWGAAGRGYDLVAWLRENRHASRTLRALHTPLKSHTHFRHVSHPIFRSHTPFSALTPSMDPHAHSSLLEPLFILACIGPHSSCTCSTHTHTSPQHHSMSQASPPPPLLELPTTKFGT